MRSFRNPRYAPESLERKLHPSGLAALPAAEVYVPTSAVPAAPLPGSATPKDTPSHPDGTDPCPPVGNGDPPMDPPGTPVGPGEPA